MLTRGSTYENRTNLAPAFLQQIIRKYEGTRLGRQELEAEILDDVPGALWTRGVIEASRACSAPTLLRVVVAIDPAATSSEDADETGIIVAGRDGQGQGWVLADASGRYPPAEWAKTAIAAYRAHRADRVVAEVNNGGFNQYFFKPAKIVFVNLACNRGLKFLDGVKPTFFLVQGNVVFPTRCDGSRTH